MLEKIRGLQGSVLAGKEANLNLESITLDVSLERGEPALILFTLLQHTTTISTSAEINTKKAIFHLRHHFHGRLQQKVESKPFNEILNLNNCF